MRVEARQHEQEEVREGEEDEGRDARAAEGREPPRAGPAAARVAREDVAVRVSRTLSMKKLTTKKPAQSLKRQPVAQSLTSQGAAASTIHIKG